MTEDLVDQGYKPCKNCDGVGKFVKQYEVLYEHIPNCKSCDYSFHSPDYDKKFKWCPANPLRIHQIVQLVLADYFADFVENYCDEDDPHSSYQEYCEKYYEEAKKFLEFSECEECKGTGKIDWVTDIMKR